jgi:hypothetical protein
LQILAVLAAQAAKIDNPSAWVSSVIKDFTATSPVRCQNSVHIETIDFSVSNQQAFES